MSMTNSKSVDNYGFMTADRWGGVCHLHNWSTHLAIQSQTVLSETWGMRSQPGSCHQNWTITPWTWWQQQQQQFRAVASALLLLGMLTWLGIQHRTTLFPEFVKVVQSVKIFCTRSISSLNPLKACRLDMESEKMMKSLSLQRLIMFNARLTA